jgi:tetratricopeptide (TPR) repeat protein
MTQPVAPRRPLKVFISYAHEDDALRTELVKHLSQLRREGLIEPWHDRLITGGSEWAGSIDKNLEAADIVLLLVSASFLASDYCNDKEMKRAIERHDANEARVIPVILRPCDWQTAAFGKLQGFPRDGKPIIEWQPVDAGYLEVARGLRRVIGEIQETMAPEQAQQSAAASVPFVPPRKRSLWAAAGLALLVLGAIGLGVRWWLDARDFTTRKAALEQQPNDPGKFDSEKFARELDALLKRAPNDPVLIMLDGDRRFRSGAPDQARERYARALEIDPKLAEAHFRLGFLSDVNGNLPDAQAHYRKALEISPMTPKYRSNYAHTLLEGGRYEDAIAEYGKIERYVLGGVEMAKARWALGQLAEARNEQARALEWMGNAAIMALPRNQETWYFFTADAEKRLLSTAEKRCYAGLSLAATWFLLENDDEARQAADAAGCTGSSEHVKEVLADDLKRYVEQVQPRWEERSRLFRVRYLGSGG